jgi:hypothetical protein
MGQEFLTKENLELKITKRGKEKGKSEEEVEWKKPNLREKPRD